MGGRCDSNGSQSSLCILHNFLCCVRPPVSAVAGWLSAKSRPRLDSFHPIAFFFFFCWCTLMTIQILVTRVRDCIWEKLCHWFLTVCQPRCSLPAETISINAGKEGEDREVWKSEKDGHKAWQPPSLLVFFFSASFLDIVIHWAACSSTPVSPACVAEADMQYLLKWSRGDSCEILLL